MEFILKDKRFKTIETEAPTLYKLLTSFEVEIKNKLDLYNWRPMMT